MGRSLDQMLADEHPKVVQAANAKADEMLLDILLTELNCLLGETHMGIASANSVKQPTVTSFERTENDMKLSVLKLHVEAASAKLKLYVELPDGTHCDFTV